MKVFVAGGSGVLGRATVSALGVAASHLLPHWSSFSDAFPGSAVDGWSYAAVVFEVIASLVFGTAGMRILLRPKQRRT